MRELMKSVVFGSRDCASSSGDSLSASDSNGVVGRRH